MNDRFQISENINQNYLTYHKGLALIKRSYMFKSKSV